MLEVKDIEKLAKLARIKLTEKEMEKLLKEVDPILDYVSQIKTVVSGISEENHEKSADLVARKAGTHRNIARIETNPTETETNTEEIASNFPERDKNYLKVKKIL